MTNRLCMHVYSNLKFIVSLFLFFALQIVSFAQTPKLDSLNRAIANAKTDTARINTSNEKASSFIEINLDSADALAKENIAASKKISYIKGEADATRFLATVANFKGNYVLANQYLQTIEKIYHSLNDTFGLAKTYAGYGMMYGMQSKYDSSIIYYEKDIQYAEKLHNNKLIYTAFQNIAISYQMQSNYAVSLSYFQKALNFAEQGNDVNSQAYIWVNMGLTYDNMQDTIRAEKALLKAIGLARKAGIKNVALYAYSNLANIYIKQKKFQLAYEYAMQAVALGRETGDQGITAASLAKGSRALLELKKTTEALALAKQAVSTADSSQQPLNIHQAYSAVGSILTVQQLYQQAIPYFEKGFAAIKNSDILDEATGDAYSDLSLCYEKTGNYQKALAAYKTAAQIADSIRSTTNIRKATELNMNYEFEKKQQAQLAEKKRQDTVNKVKQIFLLAFLLVFIILSFVALVAYKNKQKANNLLNQQKIEIENTLLQLRNTQTQLIHSEKMASLGELTAGIAHEIQNPLNFVNNFSEINKELLAEMKDEIDKENKNEVKLIADDVIDNHEKINQHGKRADAIVKNMLQHSRQTKGVKELTDINKLADEYLRLSYHGLRAKDKNFNADFKTDFDAGIGNVSIFPQDVGRVLLNLFNNAFYAVNEKQKLIANGYQPIVSVQTMRLNDKVEIKVSDNGNGIPQNIIDKIFQPFFTTKPTGQGTGLGLSLAYDIITKEHSGVIKVESKEGEGSIFTIQLPVKDAI